MIINVWLALREDTDTLVRERLDWDTETQGEYTGPVPERAAALFALMADRNVVQNLFGTFKKGGKDYRAWSLYTDKGLGFIQGELDALDNEYPNRAVIGGAWYWDGAQLDDYPPHPQLINLMPDVWNGDEPPTYSPATEVTDVNLLLGQAPRDFS